MDGFTLDDIPEVELEEEKRKVDDYRKCSQKGDNRSYFAEVGQRWEYKDSDGRLVITCVGTLIEQGIEKARIMYQWSGKGRYKNFRDRGMITVSSMDLATGLTLARISYSVKIGW